ncbi:MAG: 5-(carboxyamino)imidazole ribonucleotide synthase [Rhizobacter sp.]|nr:5-(carboxyamino)imidazole ribonucleotide synthase [Chlorobiales bacterium]
MPEINSDKFYIDALISKPVALTLPVPSGTADGNFAFETNTLSYRALPENITIGILGGGQLARMSSLAAFRLGVQTAIFSESPASPAGMLTPHNFTGDLDSLESNREPLKKFAEASTVITLENEFVAIEVLEFLESHGKKVFPTSQTMRLVRDKLIQKETLKSRGLAVAPFAAMDSKASALLFGKQFGYPFLLKARCNGYDGYGNRTIRRESDLDAAMTQLGFPKRELMAEAFVGFTMELATMITRNEKGNVALYPVVETLQQNHICKTVKAPARIDDETGEAASRLALQAIEAIDGVGIFGVELFLTRQGGDLLINELAPRPHNSGHYTIEACTTSQFENHVRAVLGWPLGSPEMTSPAAVMVNLLGKRSGKISLETLKDAMRLPESAEARIHIYGKAESRAGRKLGHVTVTGSDMEKCLRAAAAADEKIIL